MTGESSHCRVLGVVLCGGKSSRMGRDKASMTHPLGESYLQFAINRLAAVCDDVIVSGETPVSHDRVSVIDAVPNQGPVMGILASLQYAKQQCFDGCLATPVDTPNLSVEDLQSLLAPWNKSPRLTLAHSDRIQPLIGIYGVDELESLQELASSSDRSLMRWIQTRNLQTVPLSLQACRNINTPEDLTNAS